MATKRIQLKDSGVLFNEEEHSYFLPEKNKYLSGITDLLQKQLFPNLHDGIDEATLAKAAQYGKICHSSIEDFDSQWINDGTQEVADYISLCQENSLTHEASEYLVSDHENYASMIDKVYRTGNNSFILGDIKTYGQMTPEKQELGRWQLSVYAYFFELQNKGAKVDRLLILHIRNKARKDGSFDHVSKCIEVKRIPSETCKEILEADLRGEKFINPYDIPSEIRQKENLIQSLLTVKKTCEEKLAVIKADVLEKMVSAGVKAWEGDIIRFTRKSGTIRQTFDLKTYREDNPNLDLSKYMKESIVSESLQISA